MKDLYARAPEKIYIRFEHDVKTSYYTFTCPGMDFIVERIGLDGIYSIIEELDSEELEESYIAYFTPTYHGWECDWRMTGKDFYERAELVEIK